MRTASKLGRIFQLLLLCWFCCDFQAGVAAAAAETTVMKVFQEWLKNFNSMEEFSRFAEALNVNDEVAGSSLSTGPKIVKLSDLDEFEFSGPVDDNELPNGSGVLRNRDIAVGAQDFCFRGRCQKSVVQVTGNFSAGNLNGVGEVVFSDGSWVRAQFRDSVLHGLAVEFDDAGKHRFAGRYSKGR